MNSKDELIARAQTAPSLKGTDVYVLLLGCTGTGKSTFIKAATGLDVPISHDFEGGTSEITPYSMAHPDGSGRNLIFVDTPGLDNQDESDESIISNIINWLDSRGRLLLSGVLAFHRINDHVMSQKVLAHLERFKKFGIHPKNTTLVCTMCDLVTDAVASANLEKLRTQDHLWGQMVRQGSLIGRFINTNQSALGIIRLMSSNDVIVAVMGPTGAGKSTFVQTMTGQDVFIGHALESGTIDVSVYHCRHPDGSGRNLVLVDTPGYNDTDRSDSEILENVAAWLARTYDNNVKLNGIFFFQRITDNRMSGSALKNLHLFQKLCGAASLKNVVLVTSNWDVVDPAIGERREQALRTDSRYWQPMVSRGSQVARFLRTVESGRDILRVLDGKAQTVTQLQNELVDESKTLAATEVGQALNDSLTQAVKTQKEICAELKRRRKEASRQKNKEREQQLKRDEDKALRLLKLMETMLEEQQKRFAKRLWWRGLGRAIRNFFAINRGRPATPV